MTWNRNGALAAAVMAACVVTLGCSTDFGSAGEFLACDAKGQCADGYTCARTELGAVCMSKAQFRERCGAEEACNGRDDNCNGIADEGFDGTGQPCDVGVGACAAMGVTVCAEDGSAVVCSAVPGAATDESCNGLDDNCDGATDEAFADLGAPCEVDIGACAATGITVCAEDGSMTACDAVPGLPTDESCNDLDDDCDEEIDEGIADVLTGTDEGECVVRVERCVEGVPTVIQEGVVPTDEVCNGLDDDCDDLTDDSVPLLVSGLAVGECRLTISECVNGAPFVTQPGVAPTDESCNGRDDNCDGTTDEDFDLLGTACSVGIGACAASGVYRCSDDGSAVACDAVAGSPSAELCDRLDNNCDAAADEPFAELGQSCTLGVGECLAEGARVCREDGFGTRCDAEPPIPGEETCNGLDDDCDGSIDDGLGDGCCTPGTARDCGTDLGACTIGTQACTLERTWGMCSGVAPSDDACDGFDNDCDGEVDEGLTGCCGVLGGTIPCSIDRGACVAGEQQCGEDGAWSACSGVIPIVDTCDGLDNNCDGDTDESFPKLGEPCSDGVGACAATGTLVCRGDGLRATCSATAGTPIAESCNGLDDDCDVEVDEGLVEFSGTDIGECQQGIRRCIGGAFTPVQEEIIPASEACNGLDDDCDGIADEDAPNCCQPSAVRSCGINRGVCTIGSQTCGNDRAWGECTGVPPTEEQCNALDDDCDGAVDDAWRLQLGTACVSGVGFCSRIGVYRCADDRSGAVCDVASGTPGTESCNGLDDDCDGTVDEIANVPPVTEGSSVGRCRPRILACIGGEMTEIQAAAGPLLETCNGLDDDCSGTADDHIASVPCYEGPIGTDGVGTCREGTTTCAGGNVRCVNQVLPNAETCDGQDNDCDGVTDGSSGLGGTPVALAQPCYSGPAGTLGVGECRNGTSQCRSYAGPIAGVPVRGVSVICETARDVCYAGWWGACTGEVDPVTEVCGDSVDGDCDTRPDGITFLEDFEDNCAMPEATVTTDVPLDCVETPVDAADPTRTPVGVKSLGMYLEIISTESRLDLEWQLDACVHAVSGSVRVRFDELTTGHAMLTLSPMFDRESAYVIFERNSTYVQVNRADGSVANAWIAEGPAFAEWYSVFWSFSEDGVMTYALNGVPIFETTLETAVDGFHISAVVDSIIGARVISQLDDVRLASP